MTVVMKAKRRSDIGVVVDLEVVVVVAADFEGRRSLLEDGDDVV